MYEGWDAGLEGQREALCTLGNGYFATRGAAAEATADGVHYPGTYVAGVYNRLRSEVAGRVVENESLVNAPNWLPMSFRAEGGGWFGGEGSEVLSHYQELDMYRGVLVRRTRWRDADDRVVQVTSRRFVSMRDPHLAGLETTVVAENWEGRLEVRSALDATVGNNGVARYRALGTVHLTPLGSGADDSKVIWLEVETNQSRIRIAVAARTRLFRLGEQLELPSEHSQSDGYIEQRFGVDIGRGEEIIVEKIAALFTSKDMAISEPLLQAREWAGGVAGSFEELLDRHAVVWSHLWRRCRIDFYRRSRLVQDHQPAHLPHPPDRLGVRPGCGRSGPGLARRGLPGACVLG